MRALLLWLLAIPVPLTPVEIWPLSVQTMCATSGGVTCRMLQNVPTRVLTTRPTTASRPDPVLTPGAVRPLTTAQLCAIRFGRDARHVTDAMKRTVAIQYGLTWRDHTRYEFDHLIPRELGGADTLANLWPQPWHDARIKDREENRLHRAVCAGTITLATAQTQMRLWGRTP